MFDVRAGITWIAVFIVLGIVALLLGGATGLVGALVAFGLAFFTGFSCILIVLGEIRDVLAGTSPRSDPGDTEMH
ncbi:hypothetical protein J2741_002556 [Methanolinea mesophila]|uniref:hypothetical protein n=1 Tax=Methanolinea mesophila TaxID=547055 RepID=UPI001AE12778|nr:hypothetical protein [Methanolinea mesophila]MBP1929960.1 hypothetical protein [Methanolinea mesophila]